MFIFVPTKAVSALERRSSPGQGLLLMKKRRAST
jgi:hypothetical protein